MSIRFTSKLLQNRDLKRFKQPQKKRIRSLDLVFAAILCMFLQPAVADVNLRFGVYTVEQPTAMVKAYRPILTLLETRLSERLGEPVDISLKVASTYEKGVNALVEGKVDFSAIGPASYIAASDRNAGLRILALDSKDGSRTFNGVIAVKEESGIRSIEDLRDKSFAFGNQQSTIGRYLAQAHLLSNEVSASTLKHFDYLGRHDRVGHAVSNGGFDAGALKESTYNKLNKKGAGLRALAIMPNINRPWVASSDLDDRIFVALREIMLELRDEKAFKAFSRKQFVAGGDRDFDVIRNAIQDNGAFFDEVNQDSTMATIEE